MSVTCLAAGDRQADSLSSLDEGVTASLLPFSVSDLFAGEGNSLEDAMLPDNPNAIDHCLAKIRVESARLRQGPSLQAPIVGTKNLDQPVFVQQIVGKWARVQLEDGSEAYVAAYLLAFSWHELLEQWKKDTPRPTVGKKAKVKCVKAKPPISPSHNQGGAISMNALRRYDLTS